MNNAHTPIGLVRRFADYSQAQFTKLKEDFQLRMSLEMLRFCADCYQKLKRDPSLDELLLLDAMSSLSPRAENLMISQLCTNDPFEASTYSDMMNKRRELSPDADHPISLTEALNLASAYLERCGKARELKNNTLSFASTEELNSNTAGASGASVLLSMNGHPALREGDTAILLHRGRTPTWKYQSKIESLFSDEEVHAVIKRHQSVPADGLLPMLLALRDGWSLRLDVLAPDGYTATLAQLVGKFSDYSVVIVSENEVPSVVMRAREVGLRPITFAVLKAEHRVEMIYSKERSISFDSVFLRRIYTRQFSTAELPDEHSIDPIGITVNLNDLSHCKYLSEHATAQRATAANGIGVACACVRSSRNPMRSALQAGLYAVLSTAAAGCDYDDCRLAVSLSYPLSAQSPKRIGETVSAILGIYRFQCELGIPAAITSIDRNDALSEMEFNLFSVSPTPMVKSEFSHVGNALYCITPLLDGSGYPDFQALRALLKELRELHKQGVISAARVLSNQRLTDAVLQMETDDLTFHLTDPRALVGDALPLAIVLEAGADLPYDKIGYVKKQIVSPHEDNPVPLPILSQTLNRGEAYEVLILAKAGDTDSLMLARLLRGYGADCTLLHDPKALYYELSRQMMHAQAVFVCGEVEIPVGAQISFARDVLRSAGGTVIQLGNNPKLPDLFADQILFDGISRSVLMNIQSKNEKNENFSQKKEEN